MILKSPYLTTFVGYTIKRHNLLYQVKKYNVNSDPYLSSNIKTDKMEMNMCQYSQRGQNTK